MMVKPAMTQQNSTSTHGRSIAKDASCEAAQGCVRQAKFTSEENLWEQKRKQQRRDLACLSAGYATQDQMSWFSGGRARACRLIDSPY
jgi:hypothetical protein